MLFKKWVIYFFIKYVAEPLSNDTTKYIKWLTEKNSTLAIIFYMSI